MAFSYIREKHPGKLFTANNSLLQVLGKAHESGLNLKFFFPPFKEDIKLLLKTEHHQNTLLKTELDNKNHFDLNC